MSSTPVYRARLNVGALVVWSTVMVLLCLVVLLGEMRQARESLAADIVQLHGDVKGVLSRPALLDPALASRVAQLGRGVERIEERLQKEWRLIGLHEQRLRLQRLRVDVSTLESELKDTAALEQLLDEMVDLPSTDFQIGRLEQSLQSTAAPASELVRLRAFLAARKPVPEAGAEPDQFLLGVDKAADRLRAGMAFVDRTEARRTEVLVLLDDVHSAALAAVRSWPIAAQFFLTLAAIGGVILLGLPACRRVERLERLERLERAEAPAVPALPERARVALPVAAPPLRHADEPVFSLAHEPHGLDWQKLPGLPDLPGLPGRERVEPTADLVAVPPAPAPAPALSVAPARVAHEPDLSDLQRSVDSALESNLNFEKRVRGLVESADVQPNELLQQAGEIFDELEGILQRAREGALNMAFGLDESPAGEERFAAAERLEQLLVAGMACLKRWQSWSAQNIGGGGTQQAATRRALAALQFELQHQLARQQTELKNLSRRLEHAQTSRLLAT